jgi:hypothetical protein
MRSLGVVALVLALGACGGGGGGGYPDTPPTPAPPRTTKALACYFGERASDVLATLDHTNCVEAASFYGPLEQLATLTQTKGTGIAVILVLPGCDVPVAQVEPELTFWLQRIATAQLLEGQNFVAVRVCDEPDGSTTPRTDAEMKQIITSAHAAMAKFPALIAKPITTMYYECGSGSRPGLEFVDWPACDAYGWTWDQLMGAYREFEGLVNKEPDRKLVLIAGGCDPWRQDPTPFVDKLLSDGRYAMVQGFGYGPLGNNPNCVSTNGLRDLYATQFKRVK